MQEFLLQFLTVLSHRSQKLKTRILSTMSYLKNCILSGLTGLRHPMA
jgi:hypothetical protein